MSPDGYQQIVEALEGIPAAVSPEPAEGEDVRYVDIRTNQDTEPQTLLNALGRAGLMHTDSVSSRGPSDPALEVVSSELRTVAGSDMRQMGPRGQNSLRPQARVTTFEDHASR